ncbi:MAG: DUF6242 domain-containing protein [Bacteroidaceae bacterium]|nr:DUF6242 domain-containing protein [Bacteroidaceae bacterium]
MKLKSLAYLTILSATLFFTSCMEGTTDDEVVSNVQIGITAFSMNDIISDTDTASGSDYLFTIDQLNNRIYNIDSLPYNTNVEKVRVNISILGYLTYQKEDVEVAWTSTDSIDFSSPVYFKMYGTDGIATKNYTAEIRVHQVKPDTLIWHTEKNTNFPSSPNNLGLKAVRAAGKTYVFITKAGQLEVTASTDGKEWSASTPINLPNRVEADAVVAFNNTLYMAAEGAVYTSVDGIDWTLLTDASAQVDLFVGQSSKLLIGLKDQHFVYATLENGTLTWEQSNDAKPENFATAPYQSCSRTLNTNSKIEDIIVLGADNTIWSFLTSDKNWVKYFTTEGYELPNLAKMSLIRYDEKLYTFGSLGTFNDEATGAFASFYESIDNGVSWKEKTKEMTLSTDFFNEKDTYTTLVDEDKYIWMIFAESNTIWKGKLNRFSFLLQ